MINTQKYKKFFYSILIVQSLNISSIFTTFLAVKDYYKYVGCKQTEKPLNPFTQTIPPPYPYNTPPELSTVPYKRRPGR